MGPRLRRRTLASVLGAATLLFVLGYGIVRGTLADGFLDRAAPGEPARAQLVRLFDGTCFVRATRVVDAAPAVVWAQLNDFAEYPRIWPGIASVRLVRGMWGVDLLRTVARTPVGEHALALTLVRDVSSERAQLGWMGGGGDVRVDRGAWELTPEGSGTRIVYLVELSIAPYPDFLVRAVLRELAPGVLEELAQALSFRKEARP